MIDVISEKDRRLNLWHIISKERLDDLEPGRLRDLGLYGGAQGFGSIRLTPLVQRSGRTERPSRYFIPVVITPTISPTTA
jgi:hypothetical protein